MRASQSPSVALRIVTQYRSAGGFVYELQREGDIVDVYVPYADTKTESGFLVEARSGHAADSVQFTGTGPTRRAALQNAGVTWNENAGKFMLPTFEWETVAALLSKVGALEASPEERR